MHIKFIIILSSDQPFFFLFFLFLPFIFRECLLYFKRWCHFTFVDMMLNWRTIQFHNWSNCHSCLRVHVLTPLGKFSRVISYTFFLKAINLVHYISLGNIFLLLHVILLRFVHFYPPLSMNAVVYMKTSKYVWT